MAKLYTVQELVNISTAYLRDKGVTAPDWMLKF